MPTTNTQYQTHSVKTPTCGRHFWSGAGLEPPSHRPSEQLRAPWRPPGATRARHTAPGQLGTPPGRGAAFGLVGQLVWLSSSPGDQPRSAGPTAPSAGPSPPPGGLGGAVRAARWRQVATVPWGGPWAARGGHAGARCVLWRPSATTPRRNPGHRPGPLGRGRGTSDDTGTPTGRPAPAPPPQGTPGTSPGPGAAWGWVRWPGGGLLGATRATTTPPAPA